MKKETIRIETQRFVSQYQGLHLAETKWQPPLVGFASATDPLFHEFKRVISPTHFLPRDLLPEAGTVVAFLLPFEKSIVSSNITGRLASPGMGTGIRGYQCPHSKGGATYAKIYRKNPVTPVFVTPPTHNFDPKILLSDWSHRHVAFAAGLGRFGLHNMLITQKGCCGRIGSFITNVNH